MPLDPQTRAVLERLKSINFVMAHTMTPTQVRERQRGLLRLTTIAAPEVVAGVENSSLPGPYGEIPLRVYTPSGHGPFPLLIYFHSGGGVVGDLDSEDALCRRLVNLAQCLVFSVDYRLAPEYHFPVGQEESYAATNWIAAHAASFNGSSAQIAVGGMSAGGNLAATVTHMVRDRGGPELVFQLLLTPITDFRLPPTFSLAAYAEGYLLTRKDIDWYLAHCLEREEDRHNPLASPYLSSTFSGLPPALIVTAEYDPLRDDGERYGMRLKAAGIPVTLSRRSGAIHGFFVSDQLQAVLAESASALRAAFAASVQADCCPHAGADHPEHLSLTATLCCAGTSNEHWAELTDNSPSL